jgi:RecB family endonuclease NucS
MIDIAQLREADVHARWEELLKSAGIEPSAQEVRFGALKIDAIGRDKTSDSIVVVEFKVNRHTGSVGQVLVYMNAVRRMSESLPRAPQVTGLLATTYLDEGVVELLRHHGLDKLISVKMIQRTRAGGLRLVDPGEVPEEHLGLQYEKGSSTHRFETDPQHGWKLTKT